MLNAVNTSAEGIFDDRTAAAGEADALIAHRIIACRAALGRPVLAGLSGAQGSGKSTTALRLAKRLHDAGFSVAVLSLDDFYLTRAERALLSRDVHPLLSTRGVPGTHDVPMAVRTIEALQAQHGVTAAPVFDKPSDDRAPPAEWPRYASPVDIVLFEGWCVGVRPMPEDGLAHPINALERHEDAEGRWRRHVDAALRAEYRRLFDRIDFLVLLRAPGFEEVHRWRAEQEMNLTRSHDVSASIMNDAAIARFIAHYERLTRWILTDEPADLVIDIDTDRTPLRWRRGRRRCP